MTKEGGAASVIRRAYLFRSLSDAELEHFSRMARFESYGTDRMILSEGEEGRTLYLVLSGSVRVTRSVGGENEQVIGFVKTGDFFGEMALLDRRPRSASVHANEPVELALFDHDDINRVFESNPSIGYRVVRAFAEVVSMRLRDTNDRLKALLVLDRSF